MIVITGSGSGLGKALYKALTDTGVYVCGIDIKEKGGTVDVSADVALHSGWDAVHNSGLIDIPCVSVLINCVGINKICRFEDITVEDLDRTMDVNLKSILLASQFFLPGLKNTKGTILNVVSNASHMPMTDSFVYNSTKGAAAIATKQMARELTKRHGITVFGISPNKLSGTEMSDYIDNTFPPMRGMTYEQGRKYQLNGMLTGKETEPGQIAELVAFLLSKKHRHEYLSGCILDLGL